MLRDLTKRDWLDWLCLPEDRVPHALVLRGTRNLKTNYGKHKELLINVLEIGSPNGIFEDVLIGDYQGIAIGYASVYGDSMASEIAHVFGVLGTTTVIQTGCCGAVVDEILAGDIVCAAAAYCGEGASQYYAPGKREVIASPDLVHLAKRYGPDHIGMHTGKVYTTAALLAESDMDIRRWKEEGYIAVDMETAATYAVADHFGMQCISLLFAFDNPSKGEHILLSDADKQQRRATGEMAMIKQVFSIVEHLYGNR